MDPHKINVHLVAHSHDDLGWRKTLDQYYYGLNNTEQPAGLQYLWDTVIYELDKNPERKFLQVETAYLKKWYDEAPQFGFQNVFFIRHVIGPTGKKDFENYLKHERDLLKKLINNGQFEILNGGWGINDETISHYTGIIEES